MKKGCSSGTCHCNCRLPPQIPAFPFPVISEKHFLLCWLPDWVPDRRAVLSFLPDCRAAVSSTHCLPVPVPRPEPLPGAWSFAGSDRWAAHWSRVRTAHWEPCVSSRLFLSFSLRCYGDIRFVCIYLPVRS